ncbi:50S ribosomal protein L20 [SCandidatus Aminicenantes bacterium Aminicenantia_JdfR_composite]|nr:50S ribosomal protein L20 [SCandidatus Aminicenantes bacterium Aminicenantia_JdfR_composite]MCP2597057.1 50S ribosomal protein L20 [Candidatus Aminicenantes bacterium AC-335-G13]MCP2598589.1 50S ribosomal protein L20 [Candidatus Aminicenantes bacterium AC-335-L06]MCP2605464.1 50S ribosomal protein L20 [Candidatus Aminicenantes bacterium AC-335-O07]
MPRVKRGPRKARRRKKILKQAKGYWGAKHRLYRTAKEAVEKALVYSYRDRRNRKRDFRRLWIIRINAATSQYGLSYSKFMYGLKKLNIAINRKMLADMAVNNPQSFDQLVQRVKEVV